MRIKFNPQALQKVDRAIVQSFQKTVDAYADQCQTEIESEKWQWDGYTHRTNGEIVGSPRNIVDTGELRDSQQDPMYTTPTHATIEWTAGHAAEVHEGKSEDGKLFPARPWTETAKEELNLETTMATELRARL